MAYRTRIEITSKILEIAVGGALKTRIMYGAYLSFPQTREYLDFLQEKGLLEYHKDDKQYWTTEKGKTFLTEIVEMQQLLTPSNENALMLAD
jgi:predicted transcriptional regulator